MKKFKILHTADLHLDSNMFSLGKLANLRKQELLETYAKIIDIANEQNVDAIIISGDFFDSSNVSVSTIKFVARKFNEIIHIPVFIALGNHDYNFKEDMPTNVHIFRDSIEKISLLNADIYGLSFAQEVCKGSCLEGFIVDDSNKINIVAIHADVVENGGVSNYNPLTPAAIAQSKADYFALGHIHEYSGIKTTGNTSYAYCGIPEGRGFDELCLKGVIIADIYKNHVDATFIPICKREFIEQDIDISGLNDYHEICELIKKNATSEKNLYKINIIGKTNIFLNTALIVEMLQEQYFYIKINDQTKPSIDISIVASEYSLKGIFAKYCLENSYSENIFKMGIAALDGEKVGKK